MRQALIGLAVVILGSAPAASAGHRGVHSVSGATAGPVTITVVAGRPSENKFTISPRTFRHGTVIFKVTNVGKLGHGFEINGGHSKFLKPRQTGSFTVVFKHAGKYLYQCLGGPDEDFDDGSCDGGVLKVT